MHNVHIPLSGFHDISNDVSKLEPTSIADGYRAIELHWPCWATYLDPNRCIQKVIYIIVFNKIEENGTPTIKVRSNNCGNNEL